MSSQDGVNVPPTQGSVLEQPAVIQRIARALDDDCRRYPFPAPHCVPAVLLRWEFMNGILRIGSAKVTDVEPHICYLRIGDIQLTFAQMMMQAAGQSVATTPRLQEIGEVMGGKPPRKLVLE
jgi:hypothetical protein